jgi:hypothetical protein
MKRLGIAIVCALCSSPVLAYSWGLGTLPSSNGVYPIVATSYASGTVTCTAQYEVNWSDPEGLGQSELVNLSSFTLSPGETKVIGSFDSHVHPNSTMMNGFAFCN